VNHKESSIKVYWTKEYSRFKYIKGNRPINQRKVKRIIDDIKKGVVFLKYCPIVVNEEMEILDGQHRFHVSQKLKENVYYIIAKDFTIQEIAKINSKTEKWKNEDFLNCYIKQNNPHYKELRNFLFEYNLSIGLGVSVLFTGKFGGGGRILEAFREGQFEVKYLKETKAFFEFAELFKDFNHYSTRPFLSALQTIYESGKCDHTRLVENFNKLIDTIERQTNPKQYLTELEKIYNHRLRERVTIY